LRDARKHAPDAALLDIQLPGINGFQVLAALREERGAGLPVIAVTASVMDHDRRKILAAGFDGYISKPVNIRELLDTLNALLARCATS
jgi:DNA-binding response OmpR family regulator